MLLLRGATVRNRMLRVVIRFNTCSSCEEQLAGGIVSTVSAVQFQYMLLLRGATLWSGTARRLHAWFQYMLLLRGATEHPGCLTRSHHGFNTCSSCEEQPHVLPFPFRRITVSIHAPLARSNSATIQLETQNQFQYMLLLRGATAPCDMPFFFARFQYMLLLRGAT